MKDNSPLIARINFPVLSTPVRAYVHNAGFKEVYKSVDRCEEHLLSVLRDYRMEFSSYDFMIAIIWGETDGDENKNRNLNFSGINFEESWPGNIDAEPFFYQNGLFLPKNSVHSKGKFCGDVHIILGREEEYRRTCKSKDDYIFKNPNFGDFLDLTPQK